MRLPCLHVLHTAARPAACARLLGDPTLLRLQLLARVPVLIASLSGGSGGGLPCAAWAAIAGRPDARPPARRPVRILESSDGVGGRVRSDVVDGFILDRGFQVSIEAYPEQRRLLDYEALELNRLLPGALVRLGGAFLHVSVESFDLGHFLP